MQNQKKVLIVDVAHDERNWHDILFRELRRRNKIGLNGEIALLSATSAREAEDLFNANRGDIAAVVIGDLPRTVTLVRRFRAVFSGPILAASNEADRRYELVLAGCDHQATKSVLPDRLLQVLGV
jgi:hypothetical protein